MKETRMPSALAANLVAISGNALYSNMCWELILLNYYHISQWPLSQTHKPYDTPCISQS